eukprot:CAMPEP_0195517830 /NCGR_PEP_ID=MMETSP0794_2-20130614/11774_1 /TAXON_ID=515487 /ORGANISM="Stephanopyxis turris, Strain CCMP 815" /LENGTH=536 /DNA_ID=CAMNT_0040646703 /DNA_START=84 /DNA_END=1691 /DNA_ORIENTATION=+
MNTNGVMPLLTLLLIACFFSLSVAREEDKHDLCNFWANHGECESNPNYMLSNCGASCTARKASRTKSNLSWSDEKHAPLVSWDEPEQDSDEDDIFADPANALLEEVKQRSNDAETCPAPGSPPPIVRLPKNYPADLTLAPPLEDGAIGPTLDEVQSVGRLLSVQYINKHYSGPKTMVGGAVACKVVNFTGRKFKKMWDNGSPEGVYNGELSSKLGAKDTMNTYDTHAFKFIDAETGELYRRITFKNGVYMIILEPHKDDPRYDEITSSELYRNAQEELQFMKRYYRHYKYPWLSAYGRPVPELNMWPANYVGQTHEITSHHSYWVCDDIRDKEKCHPSGGQSVHLNLTVASHAPHGPRVLVIDDLLSEAECDHILKLGNTVVRDSMVGNGASGGFKSSSRTSSTGWLPRNKSPILDTLQRRFADVLGIDESLLHSHKAAEDLQVVRYNPGQEYNPHHDFGDSGDGIGQRFLTLLLYVVVPEEGGMTSFPKAFDGKGLRVKPAKRGGAVLFYSMLPDGNGDDLSLHAGEKVFKGDKW